MAEPRGVGDRPAALPPADRTVGQLVGESIRFYGEHFWHCLALGLAPAALAVVGANVSRNVTIVLSPTLFGALLSAAYVGACVLVLENRPDDRRLVAAWVAGWLVFAPVPFLVLGFLIPGVAWLAAFGLVVPALIVEALPLRVSAFRRAWQLARADYMHAFGAVATLAVVVFLTQAVLAFTLRNFGGAGVSVAFFLAIVVVSPLLFLGTALLYVDQAARVE